MLSYFIENYFVVVLAACAFLVFIRFDCKDSDRSMQGFFYSTVCILVLIFSEMADHWLSTLPYPTFMRVCTSAVGYAVRPMIAYFIARVPARNTKMTDIWYLKLPLAVNCIFAATAFFSPLVFSFDENNLFRRGPLGYVTFAIGAYYLLVLVVLGWHCTRRGERQEAIICIFTAVACFGCVYLESAFGYVGRLAAVALLGEIYYFMHMLMTKYSVDHLTGAYVRKHLYRDIAVNGTVRYYITFDVNGLKRINDSFGHSAGDRALTVFSDAVYEYLPGAARFYRLGGDEFAIVYRTESEADVAKLLEQITARCRQLPYGVSSGYARFDDGREFDAASTAADEMLYKNKKAFWHDYAEKHPELEIPISRRE